MADANFDAGFSVPATNNFKWGKPGDVIRGTLLSVSSFEGTYGPCKRYEIKADAGSFHNINEDEKGDFVADDKPTELVAGETYAVLGKSMLDDAWSKAKVGQKVLGRFVEMRKPKAGGKPYKFLEGKVGPMDPDFKAEATENIRF